jgi:hypothetical protein
MNYKIGVDFTGLCVFSTKDVPKKLHVLLGADPMGHMHHRPLLSFDVRHHKMFEGGPMNGITQLPDGRQIASWNLEGRMVRLHPAVGKAHPKHVVLCGGGVPSTRTPQDPKSEMDLCWVPSLGRIAGQGNVNPIYLKENPVPSSGPSALAARVDFDRGVLFSNASINRRQPNQFWTIPTLSGGPLHQYLADTVRLEMDVEIEDSSPQKTTPTLEISATRFGTGDTETLTLEPVDGRIDFTITNLPDVLPVSADQVKTMMHFGLYYDLLDPIPQKRPIPILNDGSGPSPLPPHEHGMGIERAAIEGVYPVKCTPSMLP